MCKKNLLIFITLILLGCANYKKREPDYYRNLYTGETYTKEEFKVFHDSLLVRYSDSVNTPEIYYNGRTNIKSGDSIIKRFYYDVKVGNKFIVRSEKIYQYINKKLPLRKLKMINGDSLDLNILVGKPIMLNIWYTGCAPCIKEMPELNKLKEMYNDKVHFIAITFDEQDEVDIFLEGNNFDFLQIVDARNYINELGIRGTPTNLFIDKDGKLISIERGIPYNSKEKIWFTGNFVKKLGELL